jgi:hypothetical protein
MDVSDSPDNKPPINMANNITLTEGAGTNGINPKLFSCMYLGSATSYDTKKAGTKTSFLGVENKGTLAIIKPGPTLPNSHPHVKRLISASKTNSTVVIRNFSLEKNYSKTNLSDSPLYYQINKESSVEIVKDPCSIMRTYEHSNFGTVADFEAAADKSPFNGIFRVIENPSLSDDGRTLYIRAALNDSHPTTVGTQLTNLQWIVNSSCCLHAQN